MVHPSFSGRRLALLDDRLFVAVTYNSCDGLIGHFERPSRTDPYTAQNADDANKELDEGCGALIDGDSHWVDVEFEEDAWNTGAVLDLAGVVGHAVLVGTNGERAWGMIGCGHDRHKVLVDSES